MTAEETREAGQLMIDWADQQFDVESQLRHEMRVWGAAKPHWNWAEFRYRRKPTPTLRPYTPEECLKFMGHKFLAPNKQVCEVIAVHAWPDTTELTIQDSSMGFSVTVEQFLGRYTHPDGSPCGVEEE